MHVVSGGFQSIFRFYLKQTMIDISGIFIQII